MKKLDSSLFDWLAWRRGCPLDVFGIAARKGDLIAKGDILRQHAFGWCPGENVVCRPKLNTIAVMYEVNVMELWFHMRNSEFAAIFPGLTK